MSETAIEKKHDCDCWFGALSIERVAKITDGNGPNV